MATKLALRGILPAMITPFSPDGAVNTEALTSHTRRLIDAGVGGLIPGGSTGEFSSLSHAERELVHSTVISAAEGRVPVVPQTGAMTAREAIELSTHAEKLGAAGVMVAPPYYDPLSFAELHAYYSAVAGAISIPVMLYHIPSVTGQQLTPAQIGELAEIPGVASIKDSSGNASELTELLQVYGDRLQICNGWDTLTFFGLASGAKASVWGAANIFPELAVELFDAVAEKGDLDAGRAVWSRLYPIVAFLEAESYAARVKAASQLVGIPAGPPRLPLLPAGEADVATLRGLLQCAGLTLREPVDVAG
jgi:4-hydroxy-tetrahydrodipicolinate synthase